MLTITTPIAAVTEVPLMEHELAPPEIPCYKANVGYTDVYCHADERMRAV